MILDDKNIEINKEDFDITPWQVTFFLRQTHNPIETTDEIVISAAESLHSSKASRVAGNG